LKILRRIRPWINRAKHPASAEIPRTHRFHRALGRLSVRSLLCAVGRPVVLVLGDLTICMLDASVVKSELSVSEGPQKLTIYDTDACLQR